MRQRPVPYLVLMQWNINVVIWWNFHDGLHWKLSKWQLLVQPVMKISSKWWHFRLSVMTRCWAITFRNADLFRFGKIIYTICKSECITEIVILNFYLNVLSEKVCQFSLASVCFASGARCAVGWFCNYGRGGGWIVFNMRWEGLQWGSIMGDNWHHRVSPVSIHVTGMIFLQFAGDIFKCIFLTHWGRDKMAAISQTTLSIAFPWMKMLEFRLNFHWSLFLRVQLTIFQHWFR